MDKSFWQGVIAAEYAVPDGYSAPELLSDLTRYLGATDAFLRDDIGYGVFVRWLLAGHFSPDDLRALLAQLQANLNAGIGEQDTDSVFLRSFSVLLLAASAYYDNHKQHFLTADEVSELVTHALAYFRAEQDLRGYVPGKGWAHACAHTADLIDELVQHRHVGAETTGTLLDAIAAKVLAPAGYLFRHDEDERLSVAVVSALARDEVPGAFVAAWLLRFTRWLEQHPRHTLVDDPARYPAYLNAKNLLRSLHLRLIAAADLPDSARRYAPEVLAALRAYSLGL